MPSVSLWATWVSCRACTASFALGLRQRRARETALSGSRPYVAGKFAPSLYRLALSGLSGTAVLRRVNSFVEGVRPPESCGRLDQQEIGRGNVVSHLKQWILSSQQFRLLRPAAIFNDETIVTFLKSHPSDSSGVPLNFLRN